MNGRPMCALHLAAGNQEECPGSACAFWEAGGAVVEPGCVFERVRFELDARPDVARLLLNMRYDLENAQSAYETRRIRMSLNELLPPGLHD